MTAIQLAPGQTWIDLIPFVFALLVMPLTSIYSGRQIARNPEKSLISRYIRTLMRGWLFVVLITALWSRTGRSAAALGLDIPVGTPGLFGLLFNAAAVAALAFQFWRFEKLVKPERAARLRKQMTDIKILPRSLPELLVFLLLALTAGVWEELVYRGFMFWFLSPYVGLIGAILISSLIFAVGHFYQGWRGAFFSGVLGLAFAVGYALTHSLWWLMIAHALVDLNGGFVAFRVMRMTAAAPA